MLRGGESQRVGRRSGRKDGTWLGLVQAKEVAGAEGRQWAHDFAANQTARQWAEEFSATWPGPQVLPLFWCFAAVVAS